MSTVREHLAGSIFPRLNCRPFLQDAAYSATIRGLIHDEVVGGFVLFDGNANDARETASQVQELAQGTLLLAADCEDGITMRFPGGTEFPSMMALGAANDLSVTYTVAQSIADEMRELGILWNFAPVADINTNPDNPIINIRAFGGTPKLVEEHVVAYLRGIQDRGVAACAKHFPGHGDTSLDSHRELPSLPFDAKRLWQVELRPFAEAVRCGVRSIMSSHVAVPAIDPSGAPASLSPMLTERLLRHELGYDGVIVTDALDMHAVTKRWSDGEASVLAYLAGNDVLETMPAPRATLEALCHAAESGRISAKRIAQTTERLASLRQWIDSKANAPHSTPQSRGLYALEAARRSLQVRGEFAHPGAPLFVLGFTDTLDNPKPEEWFLYFSSWYPEDADVAVVTREVSAKDQAEIRKKIEGAGGLLLALFVKPRGYAGTVGLSNDQMELLRDLPLRPTALLNFGNPYLLTDLEATLRIDAFSASSPSLAASIEYLSRAHSDLRPHRQG